MFLKNLVGVTGEFAVYAMDVAFAVHLSNGECTLIGETMAAVNSKNHLLTKQRNRMSALVGFFARQCIDDDLEIASQKARTQIFCIRVAKLQLHVGMADPNIGDEIDDLVRRDCAHDAQLERHLLREVVRQALHQRRVMVNRLQMRPDHLAEVREVCRFAVAVKKLSTELLFEKLDCPRQGGLRHIALFACAREIQFLCHRKEITNLVHFHDNLSEQSQRPTAIRERLYRQSWPLVLHLAAASSANGNFDAARSVENRLDGNQHPNPSNCGANAESLRRKLQNCSLLGLQLGSAQRNPSFRVPISTEGRPNWHGARNQPIAVLKW